VSPDDDDKYLRDSEIALMDALKTAFDLMMYAGVKPAQIDKLLASQVARYPAEHMPRAIEVMERLRTFVRNSDRQSHREQLRQLLGELPAGSA
jgi:hypothetical protein